MVEDLAYDELREAFEACYRVMFSALNGDPWIRKDLIVAYDMAKKLGIGDK